MNGQTRNTNTPRAYYLENSSWRWYIATIANYNIVCCEAAQSAILVTAQLLVVVMHSAVHNADCVVERCLSVGLSVCPSRRLSYSGIVSKRLNILYVIRVIRNTSKYVRI